jgi:ABC-type transport system involved in cytochrome bd biosynthesis fused ATPase/permease subunit
LNAGANIRTYFEFSKQFYYKFVFLTIHQRLNLKVLFYEKIILLGYMGCGKSTIAVALSKNANSVCRFDKEIEEKLSFSAIFENMEK